MIIIERVYVWVGVCQPLLVVIIHMNNCIILVGFETSVQTSRPNQSNRSLYSCNIRVSYFWMWLNLDKLMEFSYTFLKYFSLTFDTLKDGLTFRFE
jgi:hypothetical protein